MSLIAELKRRNVFRVGAAYAIVAWLVVEVASVVLPTFAAPEWVMKVFTFLLVLGFPIALVLAWAFELTPEGIKREKDVESAESIAHVTGRKLDFTIIGLLAAALIFVVADNYIVTGDPVPPKTTKEQTTAVGPGGQIPAATSGERVSATEPVERRKSIAVLPFANMSGDPEQEFFSDGISEELLNVLAKVKDLRVTSRTSAFAFKGKDTSIPEIARQLGVEHVLEGSVRMAGDRVRVTTQLIEVETDSHLWSETYDRDLSDIFAVQDEIAAKVVAALKIALLGANSRPINPSRETSVEVYSDYLLARQKRKDPTFRNLDEAERLLNAVIERDPDYAPAYAALAGIYESMANTGRYSFSEASTRMQPLIKQALSLDGDLAEAWQHLAYVHQLNGDFEEARAAEAKALELDPQNAVVLGNQIGRSNWSREPERGLVYADELLRVDPLSPASLSWVGFLYQRLDRPDDAERIIARMRSIDPNNSNYVLLAWNHARFAGDMVTAMESGNQPGTFDPDDPEFFSWNAMHYFDLGDVAAAESWNEAALRIDPKSIHPMATAALIHLYRNEDAKAVAIARELTRPGSDNRAGIRGVALRILAASDLAAGNDENIIARNLTHYPELADARFDNERLGFNSSTAESFMVALDLASAYLRTGQEAKAESLLSLVESELPYWPAHSLWGHGTADVELHALRGNNKKALAALQKHAETGLRDGWRWKVLHNPNLDSIRDTPEFAEIEAEIEADMAAQLARVHEMEQNGKLITIDKATALSQ
jgi:TolB-like protein/Flp pilus assembly protein TadD